jgi:hypothetical protein
MMRHLRKSFFCGLMMLAVALAMAAPASAGVFVGWTNLTGARTSSSGQIFATEGWDSTGNNGFQLTWSINYDASRDFDWCYSYTISGIGANNPDLSKGLSHWLMQVSDGVTQSAFSLTPNLNNADGPVGQEGPKTYAPSDPGNSNPSLPGAIFAIKFPGDSSDAADTYTFYSTQAPVWGDFYAKDGRTGTGQNQVDVLAYNKGFGDTTPTAGEHSLADFGAWIARPNGTDVPPPPPPPDDGEVPEPATLAMWSGLAALGLIVHRIRR